MKNLPDGRLIVPSAVTGGFWKTDETLMTIGTVAPADGLLHSLSSYDDGTADLVYTPTPAGLGVSMASATVTNAGGSTIYLDVRMSFSYYSNAFAIVSSCILRDETIPDLTDTNEFATAGCQQEVFLVPENFSFMTVARIVTLAPGQYIQPSFAWGAPVGGGAPMLRSMSLSYTKL